MQKLIYKNENAETIEFGYKGSIIMEHLDLGSIAVKKQSAKSIGQDGVKLYANVMDTRLLTASCCIIATSEKERFDIRRNIGKVLNPNLEGELIYDNGYRQYKISSGLNTSIEFGDMFKNRKFQRFEATFFCPNPYFNDVSDTVRYFLEVTPHLHFPLKIKVPGFIFSSLAGGELSVNNNGDANTSLTIIIYGPVRNPCVSNLTTGESIRVNYELNTSERCVITTHFSNKRVTVISENGVEFNAMHYLDTSKGITFFGLIPGRNVLKFDADVGKDLGRMTVHFNPKYLIV